MRRTLLFVALAVLVAAPARGQALKLVFNQGRVSIDANAVPVRTILNEWAKVGGTKVVGAERISGAPITVKLVDVPESHALDIILRSVAGYMAAARGAVSGASIYDRIFVMVTSSGPAAAARPNAPSVPTATAAPQRFVPPRPVPQPVADEPEEEEEEEEEAEEEEEEEAAEEEDPNPPNPPAFPFPQPGQPGVRRPPTGQPIVTMNPTTRAPRGITVTPAPAPTPPFGTTGAAMPGIIQQPVQQPGQKPRPPGV